MQTSMFSSEEPRASRSRSPGSGRAWATRVATSCSPIWQLLTAIAPSGWFGRTSPVSCRREEDGTLAPSLGGWQNSGMGGPTESLTLSTCEWNAFHGPFPSGDGVCSLSDILETGDVPRRFFLSARACQGILRRAERRGKELPTMLRRALSQVAGEPSGSEKPEGRTA